GGSDRGACPAAPPPAPTRAHRSSQDRQLDTIRSGVQSTSRDNRHHLPRCQARFFRVGFGHDVAAEMTRHISRRQWTIAALVVAGASGGFAAAHRSAPSRAREATGLRLALLSAVGREAAESRASGSSAAPRGASLVTSFPAGGKTVHAV